MGLGTKRKRESLFVVWTWIGSAQCLRLSSAYGGNPGRGSLRSLCQSGSASELCQHSLHHLGPRWKLSGYPPIDEDSELVEYHGRISQHGHCFPAEKMDGLFSRGDAV